MIISYTQCDLTFVEIILLIRFVITSTVFVQFISQTLIIIIISYNHLTTNQTFSYKS